MKPSSTSVERTNLRNAMVLLFIGVVVNWWSLEATVVPDGRISGGFKLTLIAGFQAACIIVGMSMLLRRPRHWFGGAGGWLSATLTVFALSAILGLSSWGLFAYNTAHDHTVHGGHEMAPTLEQQAWADDFYRRSLQAAKDNGWFEFDQAKADGFVKMWKDKAHYQHEGNVFDDTILDPDRPEFLMYKDAPEGKLLIGFMYLVRTLEEEGPKLGGPLARWHYHPWEPFGMCALDGILPVGKPDESGVCSEGEHVTRSAEMLHVYFVDHPLGVFADGMIFPTKRSLAEVTLLHPVFVHFTVALFIVAVALDIVGKIWNRPSLHSAAWINLLLSAVATALTVAAGLAAEMRLLIDPHVHMTLTTHKQLAFGVAACLALLVIWRGALGGAFPTRGWLAYLALGVLGVGLTVATGRRGAELVYIEGVGVQAVDRLAFDSHRKRVFGEYLSKRSAPAATRQGGHESH